MSLKWACHAGDSLFHYPIIKESRPTDRSGYRPPFPVLWRTLRPPHIVWKAVWLPKVAPLLVAPLSLKQNPTPSLTVHLSQVRRGSRNNLTAQWELLASGRTLPPSFFIPPAANVFFQPLALSSPLRFLCTPHPVGRLRLAPVNTNSTFSSSSSTLGHCKFKRPCANS